MEAALGETDAQGGPIFASFMDAPERDDDDALRGDPARARTVGRVRRLMDTMMKAHDRRLIAVHQDVVCRLPARSYGTMEFDMSEPRRQALVNAGQAAMHAHLATRQDLRP
ncbi:MAG: hypothetical protein QNK04_33465 [Myxococcota bacterium]|nr:hypothetical protein [Myxococcota bacterium]